MAVDEQGPDPIRAAGVKLLGEDSVHGLRAILSIPRVAALASMSRQTLWRQVQRSATSESAASSLPEPASDAIVRMIAERVCGFHRDDAVRRVDDLIGLYSAAVDAGAEPQDLLRLGFRTMFLETFEGYGPLPGLLIHAAAGTVGGAVPDVQVNDAADRALARRLNDVLRRYYQDLNATQAPLVLFALREMDRRPRAGVAVQDICVALQGLHDGLANRRLVDADSVSADFAADAMLQLALALTEAASDERTPRGEDATTGEVGKPWPETDVGPDASARAASTNHVRVRDDSLTSEGVSSSPTGSAARADARVRSLLGDLPSALHALADRHPQPLVPRVLHWIGDIARLDPPLMRDALDFLAIAGDESVLGELRLSIRSALEGAGAPAARAQRVAQKMVEAAANGDDVVVDALVDASLSA